MKQRKLLQDIQNKRISDLTFMLTMVTKVGG